MTIAPSDQPSAKVLDQIQKRRTYIHETHLDRLMARLNTVGRNSPVKLTKKGKTELCLKASSLIDAVMKLDVSPTKKNSSWMIGHFIEGNIKRVEDFNKFATYLQTYEALRPGGYFARYPDHNKTFGDLSRITPVEMADFIDSIDTESMRSRAEIDREKEEKFFKSGAAKLWLDDETTKIVRVYTWAASCYFGRNTRWCTAADNDSETFRNYVEDSALVICLDKATNSRWQIAVPFREKGKDRLGEYSYSYGDLMLCDEKDDEINICDVDDLGPEDIPASLLTMLHMLMKSPLYGTSDFDDALYFISSQVWTEENFHAWEAWIQANEKDTYRARNGENRFSNARRWLPEGTIFTDIRSLAFLDLNDEDDYSAINLGAEGISDAFIRAAIAENPVLLVQVPDPVRYLDAVSEYDHSDIVEAIIERDKSIPFTKSMAELIAEIDPQQFSELADDIRTNDDVFKVAVTHLLQLWGRPVHDLALVIKDEEPQAA